MLSSNTLSSKPTLTTPRIIMFLCHEYIYEDLWDSLHYPLCVYTSLYNQYLSMDALLITSSACGIIEGFLSWTMF